MTTKRNAARGQRFTRTHFASIPTSIMQAGNNTDMRIIRQTCINMIGFSSIYKGVDGRHCGTVVISGQSNTDNRQEYVRRLLTSR